MVLPYNKNVQMWIISSRGKIVVNNESTLENVYWKIPQGGIEKGENPEDAVKRELKEELNIISFEIVAKAKYVHRYDWPEKLQSEKGYRGQEQTIFLILIHDDSQIKTPEEKIVGFALVTFDELLGKLVEPKRIEVAKKIWSEFEPIYRRLFSP